MLIALNTSGRERSAAGAVRGAGADARFRQAIIMGLLTLSVAGDAGPLTGSGMDQDNAIIELEISDLAYGGRGVGRAPDGMAVFVPGTLPGERVRAAIIARHKRFAEAALESVLMPSPERQAPVCPLADRCGGCAYAHVNYPAEVAFKQGQLESLLKRIGHLQDVRPDPPIPAPHDLGYRNKLVLHAGENGVLGFFEKDGRTLLDVPCCPLAVKPIQAWMAEQRADDGFRETVRAGDTLTLRWTAHDGVVAFRNDASGGDDPLTEHSPVGDLLAPRDAFFQVNPGLSGRLTETVMALIREQAPKAVLDLYGGVGVFALAAAQAGVPHVLSVERHPGAAGAARRNARRLQCPNVTVLRADAARVFAEAMRPVRAGETLVIADPPRAGLPAALCRAMADAAPAAILYVSCAPDTLARDLGILTSNGYAVSSVQMFDLFPRTAHFETLTLLRREAI